MCNDDTNGHFSFSKEQIKAIYHELQAWKDGLNVSTIDIMYNNGHLEITNTLGSHINYKRFRNSWQYFSTCQSLLNDSRIIWWKFQVITPLPTCYLTIRNPPVLEVKNLESWRTGWILVSMLANQAMSPEYSLKIWSKLAHCGLSYDYFYKRGSINQPLLCNSPHSGEVNTATIYLSPD